VLAATSGWFGPSAFSRIARDPLACFLHFTEAALILVTFGEIVQDQGH